MPNMSLKKVPMPEQEPNVRNHNFQEVSLGSVSYTHLTLPTTERV